MQLAVSSWQVFYLGSLRTSVFRLPTRLVTNTDSMIKRKYIYIVISFIFFLASCEEVIVVDLNTANPALVVEAIIYKDSVCLVRLTRTTSYFSIEQPVFIENASVKISDGALSEELSYKGNGYYTGNTIIGTEGRTYEIEIMRDGITYKGISSMPLKTDLIAVRFGKDNSQSPLNTYGETVFTFTCEFVDDPDKNNFYMIRFVSDGALLERYYLLTETSSNSGDINKINGVISFSESVFFEGGLVDVQLLSIDESVYNYFMQLSDILFWKRRVMPPTPYNPKSNISNGALGYFAAWAIDSESIILE
jgi:hypothetical protein